MKKISFVMLSALLFHFSAQANDPFDHNQRQLISESQAVSQSTSNNEKEREHSPSHYCQQNYPALFGDTPFNQIKIVGVLFHNEQKQLLLQQDRQVVLAKLEDFVGLERHQIKQVSKQKITLQDWQASDCQTPKIVEIKF